MTVRRARLWLESVEDQVSADVGRVVQTSKSDLMAKGIAFNLLQMAKRISPQCKASKYEDLSGEEGLTQDHIVVDDRSVGDRSRNLKFSTHHQDQSME